MTWSTRLTSNLAEPATTSNEWGTSERPTCAISGTCTLIVVPDTNDRDSLTPSARNRLRTTTSAMLITSGGVFAGAARMTCTPPRKSMLGEVVKRILG
jgi:hypothetical protein